MRRSALPVAIAALLVAVALAPALVGASPQPTPVCWFCGGQFEEAAADAGVNVTVAESHVVVQVHANGSATWTVRNRLAAGADRLRAGPGVVDVAQRLGGSAYGPASEVRFLAARLEGDTAVLTYRDPDAAERRAGVLVVEYLHHDGYTPWYVVNADTFTIRGPPGTVVANDPGQGTVDGRSVTWEGSTPGDVYSAPRVEETPYVVFGDADSPLTGVRTAAALALSVAPLVFERALQFLLVQTVAFAVALSVVAWAVRARNPQVDVGATGAAVAVLAAVGGLAIVVFVAPRALPGPALVAGALGALAWDGRARPRLASARGQALAAAGALAGTWALLAAVHALGGTRAPARAALQFTALAFPFAAMLPLGAALHGDRQTVLRWGAVALLAFAAMPPAIVDFAGAYSGLGAGVFAVGFLLAAVVVPVLGIPVVVLGHRLAATAPPEPPRDRVEDI